MRLSELTLEGSRRAGFSSPRVGGWVGRTPRGGAVEASLGLGSSGERRWHWNVSWCPGPVPSSSRPREAADRRTQPGKAQTASSLAHCLAQVNLNRHACLREAQPVVEPSPWMRPGHSQGGLTAATASPQTWGASRSTVYICLVSRSSGGFCPFRASWSRGWGEGENQVEVRSVGLATPSATARSHGYPECGGG